MLTSTETSPADTFPTETSPSREEAFHPVRLSSRARQRLTVLNQILAGDAPESTLHEDANAVRD